MNGMIVERLGVYAVTILKWIVKYGVGGFELVSADFGSASMAGCLSARLSTFGVSKMRLIFWHADRLPAFELRLLPTELVILADY
jgi:hypothetical protein